MTHRKNFFEILHTITSLSMEKGNRAQFLKKTLVVTKWVILTPIWAQKT